MAGSQNKELINKMADSQRQELITLPATDHHDECISQNSTTSLGPEPPVSPVSLRQSFSTEHKISMQMSRLSMLTAMQAQAAELTTSSTEEVDGHLDLLNNTWALFITDHDLLGQVCTRRFFEHPYMVGNIFGHAFNAYHQTFTALHEVKATVRTQMQNRSAAQGTAAQKEKPGTRSTLPDLKLPSFDGKYAAWSRYSEQFKALVAEHDQFTQAEKLHYLRANVSGAPAQIIQTVPLNEGAFNQASSRLSYQYSYKERIIFFNPPSASALM